MIEHKSVALGTQVSVEDDDVERADLREQPLEGGHVAGARGEGDMIHAHAIGNAAPESFVPFGTRFNADDLQRAFCPSTGGLTPAELEHPFGTEILTQAEIVPALVYHGSGRRFVSIAGGSTQERNWPLPKLNRRAVRKAVPFGGSVPWPKCTPPKNHAPVSKWQTRASAGHFPSIPWTG